MRTEQPRWADSYRSLLCFCVLTIAPGIAFAQDSPSAPPAHAHAKLYGSGWECDWGYEKVGSSCVAIQVPSHLF